MQIGVLGTGAQGGGVAIRLAAAGWHVRLGSRSSERATSRAEELNGRLGTSRVEGLTNMEVIQRSDVVILAVPFSGVGALLMDARDRFKSGSVLVDVIVPLVFDEGRARLLELPEGSASAHIARALPDHMALVGALKTIPARALERLDLPLDCDDLVYGDDSSATRRVIEILQRIDGLRPLDAGGLDVASIVEGMTLLAVGLNKKHHVKAARYKVIGV